MHGCLNQTALRKEKMSELWVEWWFGEEDGFLIALQRWHLWGMILLFSISTWVIKVYHIFWWIKQFWACSEGCSNGQGGSDTEVLTRSTSLDTRFEHDYGLPRVFRNADFIVFFDLSLNKKKKVVWSCSFAYSFIVLILSF